jgi:hypothetical protein
MAERERPTGDAQAAMRSLGIDMVTVEVVRALGAAGIEAILLKGASVARWLYDHEAERTYVDCDLLVAPTNLADAESILAGLDFRRIGLESLATDWPKHAVALRRGDGLAVDLHRSLVGIGADDVTLWSELSCRTETLEIAGAEVEVLDPPARALTIALHAAKEAARVQKVRRDLEQAVARIPFDVWQETAVLAERVEAVPAFAAGLRRDPKGTVLADRLGLPARVTVGVALRTSTPPPLAVGMDWLLRTPSWKGKFSLARWKLFPPPGFMRAWSLLARRGTWGLALSYVWRPLWVAWRAIPALRAVHRARRSARGDPGSADDVD